MNDRLTVWMRHDRVIELWLESLGAAASIRRLVSLSAIKAVFVYPEKKVQIEFQNLFEVGRKGQRNWRFMLRQ